MTALSDGTASVYVGSMPRLNYFDTEQDYTVARSATGRRAKFVAIATMPETTLENCIPPDLTYHSSAVTDNNGWIAKTIPLLTQVSKLEDGWDGEGSPGPLADIIASAKRMLFQLRSYRLGELPVPFVSPISGGGLQFEWDSAGRHLEFEFPDASRIYFLTELATAQGEITETGELSLVNIEGICSLLAWFTAI